MEKSETKLNAFESSVIGHVLKHAIYELQLLGNISGWSNDMVDFESQASTCSPNSKQDTLNKIKNEKDRKLTEDTLQTLHDEIITNGTCACLNETVEKLRIDSDAQSSIMQETINNIKAEINILKQNTSIIEKKSAEEIKRLDVEVSALKDELADANFQQEVETKFIDKWESSRINQGLMLAEMEERRLKEKLQTIQFETDEEDIVHCEIINYLDSAIMKLEEDIETWLVNYKEKMVYYDKELFITKDKREKQLIQLKSLTEKFYDHGRKITEYLEEKKERERVEALKEHLNKMATKIQAWWRGVMVRRHLGPYKKKGKTKEKPKFKGKTPNKPEASQEKSNSKTKGK